MNSNLICDNTEVKIPAIKMAFEINVTNRCNMSCSYCNLTQDSTSHIDIDKTINFIEKFISSDKAKWRAWNNYRLSLWGGEPTIEPEILRKIAYYIKEKKFKLHIYTNGLCIDHIINELTCVKEHVMFTLSFDGSAPEGGHQHPDKVKQNILTLDQLGFKFKCKPTLGWGDIKFMSAAYFEFKELNSQVSRPLSYVASLDYKHKIPKEKIPEIKKHLKEQLFIIMEDQKKDSDLGLIPFKVKFTEHHAKKDKPQCSAGANMIMLDMDGKIYPCHAALNAESQQDHFLGTIEDDPNDTINNMTKYMNILGNDYNPHCRTVCESACFNRCPVYRYADSKKDSYELRWTDYMANHELCDIFRYIHKIIDEFKTGTEDAILI